MRQLAPGDRLAGFRIEALAGRGGMGVVYRACQSRPERIVALKVIAPELAADAGFRARFERECSIAAQLEHPNVIPVYEVSEEDGLLFIVMRFVEGVDLGKLRRREGRLEPGRAVHLLAQIASALDAAHAHGLVHRDVKPGNALVSGEAPDEHVYLTDFGITSAESEDMTSTGNFLGSLDYIAPEVLSGDRAGVASDVYGLGCVLYELLSGSVPFPRDTEIAKISAHLTERAPPPSSLVASLPARLDAVVARAMAKEPGQRHPTAGQLARAATSAADQPPGAAASDLADPYAATKPGADQPLDPAPSRIVSKSNLPPAADAIVGRASEVSTALRLLARGDVRLVTLLGSGGAGKTRLALEVAAQAAPRYRDGVWFVPLAPLSDHTLAASAIANILGIKEAESEPLSVTLTKSLVDRQALLLLDNFEHLIDATGLVSQILDAAAHVDVLVTSREALHLRGEHRMEVPPLPLEHAAELFLQRARAVRLDLAENPPEREAVERICLRLDGLPLALELAAARVALFGVRALEARLAQRLDLPEGPRDLPDRQRTLQATLDWSYQLLPPHERALFGGLAPFVGGARFEAIEATSNGVTPAPVETVAALIDKSLLRRRDDSDGEPRLWMLGTIREYALKRLTDRGEADGVKARHAAYFLAFAEEADRNTRDREQPLWYERLETENDNLRAAFEYLIAHSPSEALRMAAALGDFWEIGGHLSEGREHLRRALASAPGGSAAAAKASFHAGRIAVNLGEADEAQPLLAKAVSDARAAGDTRTEAWALSHLGVVARLRGEVTRSLELLEQAVATARSSGDQWISWVTLNNLADTLHSVGETERALPLIEQALQGMRGLADEHTLAIFASNAADMALATADLQAAESLIAEALRSSRQIDFRSTVAKALALDALLALHHGELDSAAARIIDGVEMGRADYLSETTGLLLAAAGTLAAARGNPLRAAQLWAAADREMQRLGIHEIGAAKRLREELLPAARGDVDAGAWQAAWDAGAKLPPEEALELAIASNVALHESRT